MVHHHPFACPRGIEAGVGPPRDPRFKPTAFKIQALCISLRRRTHNSLILSITFLMGVSVKFKTNSPSSYMIAEEQAERWWLRRRFSSPQPPGRLHLYTLRPIEKQKNCYSHVETWTRPSQNLIFSCDTSTDGVIWKSSKLIEVPTNVVRELLVLALFHK